MQEKMNLPSRRRWQIFLCAVFRKLSIKVFLMVFLVLLALVLPSIRNRILSPFWPNGWRDVSTFDVIAMNYITRSYNGVHVEAFSCPRKIPPTVSISDINTTNVQFHSKVFKTDLRAVEHQQFLPHVTDSEKLDILRTYLIVANAFQKANIKFFFVEGTLLGVHRHRGLIPWDDDIDIAVSIANVRLVLEQLSCIDGYVLDTPPKMHWKFYQNSSEHPWFPFIDIFFYTENEEYIWSLTYYLVQSVIFSKEDTFPLTTGQFEGLTVPVPKNTDRAVRKIFDYEMCQSPSLNHKTGISFPKEERSTILCSSLSYLYDIHYLRY